MQRISLLAIVGVVALAACSSSDTDNTDNTENTGATDTSAPAATAAPSASAAPDDDEALADNSVRDDVMDAVDPSGELDDAIGSLSAETRYDIVAGQLDPEPSVEIDGDDIRLVFDDGSFESATVDCILASVTQLDTETLTLVYPDGEVIC